MSDSDKTKEIQQGAEQHALKTLLPEAVLLKARSAVRRNSSGLQRVRGCCERLREGECGKLKCDHKRTFKATTQPTEGQRQRVHR